MNVDEVDENIETTSAARLILESLRSDDFDIYKDLINMIPDVTRIKLFNTRYSYAGLKAYDSIDLGIMKSFRFVKYVDGKFKVKETFGLYGDPINEFETTDLHRVLKFCFYECNTDNAVAMKKIQIIANDFDEMLVDSM